MKQAIILLVAGIVIANNVVAQQYPLDLKQKRRMCAATIAGISGLSAGVMGTIGGLAMQLEAGAKSEKSWLPQQIVQEQYERESRGAFSNLYGNRLCNCRNSLDGLRYCNR